MLWFSPSQTPQAQLLKGNTIVKVTGFATIAGTNHTNENRTRRGVEQGDNQHSFRVSPQVCQTNRRDVSSPPRELIAFKARKRSTMLALAASFRRPGRHKQINPLGLSQHPQNSTSCHCLFQPARLCFLDWAIYDPDPKTIGTNEMRCRPRHSYSDHEDKSELSTRILVRRTTSPSAAQPRSRRSPGKAARVMKTHPIPRHSYWSGVNGEPLVLITATQDTIFNPTMHGRILFNSTQAFRLRIRVCRP